MSNNNSINVPQAKQAMDQFKMQAAQKVGLGRNVRTVPLAANAPSHLTFIAVLSEEPE